MQKPKTIASYGQIRPAKLILDPQLSDEQIIALNQFTSECDSSESGVARVPVWNLVAQALLDLVCQIERDYVYRMDAARLLEAEHPPLRRLITSSELCDHIYGHFKNLPMAITNAEKVYDEPMRTLLVHLYEAMQQYVPQLLGTSMWSRFENFIQVERFGSRMLELHFTRPA